MILALHINKRKKRIISSLTISSNKTLHYVAHVAHQITYSCHLIHILYTYFITVITVQAAVAPCVYIYAHDELQCNILVKASPYFAPKLIWATTADCRWAGGKTCTQCHIWSGYTGWNNTTGSYLKHAHMENTRSLFEMSHTVTEVMFE